VDAFTTPYHADNTELMHAEATREQIRQRAGTCFAAELVDLFLETSESEAFWLQLEPRSIETYLQDMLSKGPSYLSSMEDVRRLAKIFSHIVDAKSPFTAEHSLGVAGLVRLLTGKMGLGAVTREKIEVAGLLHDLGKLRVPDEILDKPGKPDSRERKVINAHSFETFRILRHIKGFEEIALWASYHHEEPGGHGYPFHLKGETLAIEARILRVADIFQAMVQDRPYRKGLSPSDVLTFLRNMVASGLVDARIVAVVESCVDEAMAAARGEPVLDV
jgi:putative nucleotidyltransferase with HDIG domain